MTALPLRARPWWRGASLAAGLLGSTLLFYALRAAGSGLHLALLTATVLGALPTLVRLARGHRPRGLEAFFTAMLLAAVLVALLPGDDETQALHVVNHLSVQLDGVLPLRLAAGDVGGVGHHQVRPLRRPPDAAVAVAEVGLPRQRHDLGEAAGVDLARVRPVQPEGARVHGGRRRFDYHTG